MSKTMIIPKNLEMIKNLIDKSDAFLIGIDGLSVNLPNYYSFDEIIGIVKYLNDNNKEVFISLNKNIKNSELSVLEKTMIKLNDLKIQGVFY